MPRGIGCTFLRAAYFDQNLLTEFKQEIKSEGSITLPSGDLQVRGPHACCHARAAPSCGARRGGHGPACACRLAQANGAVRAPPHLPSGLPGAPTP